MDKLFRALKNNFIFVDSRTTPNSVAKELSIKYQMPYIVRDTFWTMIEALQLFKIS